VSNFLKNLGAIKWHLEVMEVKSIGEAALAQEKWEQPPNCLTKKKNQVKQLIACQG